MTMTAETWPRASGYFAAGANFELERQRLELLEEHDDPLTVARLRATGLSPGWRCLEVGAGAGSVARWLAGQVGPDGLVVTTDIDTRFLGHLRDRVEIRQHDILTDPLEPGAYDLVHCRSLLTHLSDPAVALARMAQALRPGGWLVAENHDYSSLAAVTTGGAQADRWDRAVLTVLSVASAHGLFIPDLGRHLVSLVREAGLMIVAQEGCTSVRHGGDSVARFVRQSCRYLNGLVDFAGAGGDMEVLLTGLDDPAFEFVDAVNFGVSARRPPTETSDAGRG